MDKAVLISIRPEWVELIASGRKTVEVRKTRPKIEPPFRCYIYCTVGGTTAKERDRNLYTDLRGKVISEFVCDRIDDIMISCSDTNMRGLPFPGTCLTDREIMNYLGNGKIGFAWHISDLKTYDTPMELIEFRRVCQNDLHCESCSMFSANTNKCGNAAIYLTSPPQSWCYVEVMT